MQQSGLLDASVVDQAEATGVEQQQTTPLPGSFLTDAQRASLDAALKEKELENAAKAREHAAQQLRATGHGDKKSRNTKGTGAPKKAGGGGKWTWGSIMTDGDQTERVLDKNDPNYDSDEEKSQDMLRVHEKLKEEVQLYKQQVMSIVEEYLSNGDVANLADSLEDVGVPGFMHYFVKRLITTALDRQSREREMASVALSGLYAAVIPPTQVQKGFGALVDSIEDLQLDVPDVPELLSLFIARAVVDDVLPPAMAHRIPDGPPGSALALLKTKLETLLSARHGAEKVLRCWGSGVGVSYQDTKESITRMLEEYEDSKDVAEASRCLHSLSVPYFHHEVVKQAIHRAMAVSSTNPSLAQALITLLARLAETGELSLVQLHKGLGRVEDTLQDLVLDNPMAKEQHAAVLEMAKAADLLQMDEATSLERMGKRLSTLSLSSTSQQAGTGQNGSSTGVGGVAGFKSAAKVALLEYFDSSDAEEVCRRLTEIGEPGLLPLFVKLAVVTALDRKARERELISSLILALTPNVLSEDLMSLGFTRLLAATDDLVLDCPDAIHLLSLFLGRAIVDEVLPPAFLTTVLKGLPSESLGVSVVRATGSLLSARHGAERVTNAWRGGAISLDQVRVQMQDLLDEYALGSHDAKEAAKCLAELGVPYYHHEAVVKTIELAFSQPTKEADAISLLSSLSSTGVINQTQMTKGFQRVQGALGEETMDYGAGAADIFARIMAAGLEGKWLVMSE